MISLRSQFALGVLLALAAAAVTTWADPPASAPASAPAVIPQPSFATPADALRTYVFARYTKDTGVLRQCIEVPSAQAADINAIVDMIAASDALQKTAVARFGMEGERAFDPDRAAVLDRRLDALTKEKIEVTDGKATATPPADPASKEPPQTTALVKTAGGWKIDGASMLNPGGETPDRVAANVTLARKITEIDRQMAAAIDKGTYATAGDAYNDYWLKVSPAAQPLTAPATATGTAPASQATTP